MGRERHTIGWWRTVSSVLVLLGTVARADIPPVGTVTAVEGQVERERGDAHAWQRAGGGDEVRVGDVFRSYMDSRVMLSLQEGSVVTIGDNSFVTVLERADGPPPVTTFGIRYGTVRAAVGPGYDVPQARFDVMTPAALIRSTGGTFAMGMMLAKSTSWALAIDGVSTMRLRTGVFGVQIAPGQYAEVLEWAREPTRPIILPEARRQAFLARTEMRNLLGPLAPTTAPVVPPVVAPPTAASP